MSSGSFFKSSAKGSFSTESLQLNTKFKRGLFTASQLQELEKVVLSKKKECNSLLHSVSQQESLKSRLQSELQALGLALVPNTALELRQRTLALEHKEITEGLGNEQFFSGTLQHMLLCRSQLGNNEELPINQLTEALRSLSIRRAEAERLQHKYTSELNATTKQLLSISATDPLERHPDAACLENEHEELQRTQLVLHETLKEHRLYCAAESYKQKKTLLHAVGPLVKTLRREELSLQTLKSQLKTYNSDIEQLKQATNLPCIQDIKEYYHYLAHNQVLLQKQHSKHLKRVKTLELELRNETAEYEKITYRPDDSKPVSKSQCLAMERALCARNKEINSMEDALQSLGLILSTACSAVTRLQLQLTQNEAPCRLKKLHSMLSSCHESLRSKLRALKGASERVQEESINTSLSHSSSPHWLQLAKKPQLAPVALNFD